MKALKSHDMKLADPACPFREKLKIRASLIAQFILSTTFMVVVVCFIALGAGVLYIGSVPAMLFIWADCSDVAEQCDE